jgi:biopolymer transport protein ExbB
MLEIIKAGGWVMFPIIVCSITAVAIILERLWTLQEKRVLPQHLTKEVWEWVSTNQLNHEHLKTLEKFWPLV